MVGQKSPVDRGRRLLVVSALMTLGLPRALCATSSVETAFRATISHVFGDTIISAPPKRIVTLGWGGEDALIALGTIPIGMPRYDQFESGILPWVERELGEAKPVLFSQSEIDFEGIAVLKPDAILAVRTNIDINDWRRLNSIAPTVAYRSGPLQADWQEITQLAGLCLGKPDLAKTRIQQAKSRLQELSAAHPNISGKTFVFGSYFPGSSSLGVYLPADLRVSTLMDLGLQISPQVEALAESNSGKIGTSVSLEQLDNVETDLLIVWFPPGAKGELERQSLFQSYAPVRKGGFIALDDPISMWVTSNPSVLSIPYGFPDFVSRLSKAIVLTEQPTP